ncbi:MAG: ABC transporter permease [Anaerolineae bacterium]|nr:ABC transporter permease [Anaerolineae bacterium]
MRILWVVLRKELMEQWRSYRLLIVGVVLLLFGLASPLLARYTPEILRLALPEGEEILSLIPPPTVADAVSQYLKNITQFGVLLAVLMAMGAVALEKDKGTAGLMLVKPIPRGIFLSAKFLALGLTFAAGILLAAVAGYYYTLLLFEPLSLSAWLGLNGLLLVFILVYVALTLLCSTLTESQVVSGGLALGFVVVLSGLGAVPRLGDYLPGQLNAWAAGLFTTNGEPAWSALAVSLGLIVGALAVAWLFFERQEL